MRSKIIIFILGFLSLASKAGTPSYLIMEQNKPAKCLGVCSAKVKSHQGEFIDFDMKSSGLQKSNVEDQGMKVQKVYLGGQTFSIDMQDQFSLEEGVPFFEVSFPKEDGLTHTIYALKATSGTSGMSFHYFIKLKSGLYIYSGMHPEIVFDNEMKSFISVEKDGHKAHITTWALEEGNFISVKSEVMQ